jgi:hypothetical protein
MSDPLETEMAISLKSETISKEVRRKEERREK